MAIVRSRFVSGDFSARSVVAQANAISIESRDTSEMFRPSTVTANDSGLSRAPWQAVHGTSAMYLEISVRT